MRCNSLVIVVAAFGVLACEAAPDAAAESTGSAQTNLVAAGAPSAAPGGLALPAVQPPVATKPADRPAANPGPAVAVPQVPAGGEDFIDERLVGLHAMADDFPWGKGEDGHWTGTGVPEPDDMRKLSDAEILSRAAGLNGATVQERAHALVSAGRRHLPQAPSLAEAALATETDEKLLWEVAISAMVEMGGPEAEPVIWKAMNHPWAMVRGAAIWAAALYGTEAAKRAIDQGLTDSDMGVRGRAVLALTAIRNKDEYVFSVLTWALASPEQRLYQEACYVLAQIADARAVKMLSVALDQASADDLKRRTVRGYLRMANGKRSAAATAMRLPQ